MAVATTAATVTGAARHDREDARSDDGINNASGREHRDRPAVPDLLYRPYRPSARDDPDLLHGVLAGDRRAETRFLARFLPCIAAVVRRKGVPSAEREDLVQEVLCHLWEQDKRRLRQWQSRGQGSFAAFLFVVTERLVIDRWRCHRLSYPCLKGSDNGSANTASVAVVSVTDAVLDMVPDPAPGPAEVCLVRQQVDAILNAISLMPARDAALLRQRHLLGKSYHQIAEGLGITVNHVGVALLRAEARLRTQVRRRHQNLFAVDDHDDADRTHDQELAGAGSAGTGRGFGNAGQRAKPRRPDRRLGA